MWHKPCRTFNPWCLCIKTRCLVISLLLTRTRCWTNSQVTGVMRRSCEIPLMYAIVSCSCFFHPRSLPGTGRRFYGSGLWLLQTTYHYSYKGSWRWRHLEVSAPQTCHHVPKPGQTPWGPVYCISIQICCLTIIGITKGGFRGGAPPPPPPPPP